MIASWGGNRGGGGNGQGFFKAGLLGVGSGGVHVPLGEGGKGNFQDENQKNPGKGIRR